MVEAEALRAPYLDASLRAGPFVARRKSEHDDKQSVAILRGSDSFATLRVDDGDQVRHDGKHIFLLLLSPIVPHPEGRNVLVLKRNLYGASKRVCGLAVVGGHDALFVTDV